MLTSAAATYMQWQYLCDKLTSTTYASKHNNYSRLTTLQWYIQIGQEMSLDLD